MAAIEVEASTNIRKNFIGLCRPMRGAHIPGDAVHYCMAGQGVHQSQGDWMGPARVFGVKGSNLGGGSLGATAIKCAKEQVRMASLAEKETREMMMRLGAADPDSRKVHEPSPRQQGPTGQHPPTTENSQPTCPKEPQQQHATEQQQKPYRPHPQPPFQMQTEQFSPAPQQNRRNPEAQAEGKRKTRRPRGMVPKSSVVLEQCMMPEPA